MKLEMFTNQSSSSVHSWSTRKLADPYLREKGPWATGEKLPEGIRLPRGEWPRGRGGALSQEASAESAALILP